MNNRQAFTLVEVIVILVVLSILAAIAIPVALKIFEKTAEQGTRDEMDNIKKAMIGDPQKLQGSFRNDFGFLGDIGCLPTTLGQLTASSGLPTPYSFDSVKQTGAGWSGPYVTSPVGEALSTDQWGNNYLYAPPSCLPATNVTLTSNGPNGVAEGGAGDDIRITITPNETTATAVRGTVKDTAGNLLEAVPVEFYSAISGTLTTTGPVNTDASGNYSFSLVPFGPRAVKAKPNFLYALGSVTGGGTTIITFRILNYAETPITITHMQVSWTGGPLNYDRIRIDLGLGGGNNTCYGGPAVPNGTVVAFTAACLAANNSRVAASPAVRPSTRVFIDNNDVSLPDTTITGAATSATLDIRFSAAVPGGSTPLTITFNPQPPAVNPKSVVKFIPP